MHPDMGRDTMKSKRELLANLKMHRTSVETATEVTATARDNSNRARVWHTHSQAKLAEAQAGLDAAVAEMAEKKERRKK
jgi:hypothetical protein